MQLSTDPVINAIHLTAARGEALARAGSAAYIPAGSVALDARSIARLVPELITPTAAGGAIARHDAAAIAGKYRRAITVNPSGVFLTFPDACACGATAIRNGRREAGHGSTHCAG